MCCGRGVLNTEYNTDEKVGSFLESLGVAKDVTRKRNSETKNKRTCCLFSTRSDSHKWFEPQCIS